MKTLHERLRFLRGEEAQDSFSAKIGLKQTTWGRYERGQGVPDAEALQTICSVLNVDPTWLLFGTGSMQSDEESAPQACAEDERREYEARIAALEAEKALLHERLNQKDDTINVLTIAVKSANVQEKLSMPTEVPQFDYPDQPPARMPPPDSNSAQKK